jgi:dihydrofolate reductase
MIRRITYTMNVSLDGFINDANGSLEWANVDEEVHSWFNNEARKAAAFANGRRMWETMSSYWPTAAQHPDAAPVELEFAEIWNSTPQFVFSHSLSSVEHSARLLSGGVAGEIARINADVDGELQIGGATLAAEFIRAALIDEYGLIVHPVVLGGGTRFFLADPQPGQLRLVESKPFANGAVLLRYARS